MKSVRLKQALYAMGFSDLCISFFHSFSLNCLWIQCLIWPWICLCFLVSCHPNCLRLTLCAMIWDFSSFLLLYIFQGIYIVPCYFSFCLSLYCCFSSVIFLLGCIMIFAILMLWCRYDYSGYGASTGKVSCLALKLNLNCISLVACYKYWGKLKSNHLIFLFYKYENHLDYRSNFGLCINQNSN